MFLPPHDPTDITPIVVEVTSERYDCYGPLTPRSKYLKDVLQVLGGVSNTVAPGSYNFNVLMVEGLPIASLTPRI